MIKVKLSEKIFNKVYLPYLFDYGHKIEVYYGGAGSGKSVFIAQKLLAKALNQKRIILVVRKTLTSQQRSCWKLFTDMIDSWKIFSECKVNNSNYQISISNGSIIYIAGIDNPERIKSIVGVTDIWCEEATELDYDDYNQLKLRMRALVPDSQIICSFNPISKANWVYKQWFDQPCLDPEALVVKTTYKDNSFLPDTYVKTLEEMINTNPTYYRIYALGEFCSLDKLVYNNWEVKEFNYRDIQGELICGLDFGFSSDPSAFVAGIVQDKEIYVFRTWYETNKTNDQIALAIKSLGFSKSTIIADSAEPKSIEELKKAGLYRIRASLKGPDSLLYGIQQLQQYKIIIHPDCSEMITEIENYSWQKDKKTGEYINKPIDSFNHLLDALRYSLQCLAANKLKTMSKSLLAL